MNEKRWDLNSEKDIEAISRRIRLSYQKLTKRTSGADDCIQEILARMLEGRHQHSTIEQAVIDYLRANHGDPRVSSYFARRELEYAHSLEPGEMERIPELSYGGQSPARLDFVECRKWIGNQIDRAIFGLSFEWGLNAIEIGNLFGFGESRVSQRLKRIQSRVSARVKSQERAALSSEAQGKMARVLRPEAERQLWGVGEITFERMETGKSFGVESFNEKSF